MQLAEEAGTRHPLCDRAVPQPVHGQRDLSHALPSVKARANAEERRFSSGRQRQNLGHGTIQDDLEPLFIGWIEVRPPSAHAANITRFQSLAIFPWK
jgi:hypothetical protein